jgi:antitoxin (DNA-binding transcriptional repressor) of toxin-antitoxin stability system
MKFVNVKELHDKTSEILRKIEFEGEEVVVTLYGKPKAIIRRLTEEEVEDYILANHPKFKKALEKSYQDVSAGKVTSLDELIAKTEEELGLSG